MTMRIKRQLDDPGDRRRRGRSRSIYHHNAADGNGARIVATHPTKLFSRNQAVTDLTLTERSLLGLRR